MKILKFLLLKSKILKRNWSDFFSSNSFSKIRKLSIHQFSTSISQDFKPTSTLENKIHNIKIAAEKINQHVIFPNEIFSFWNIVGNPNNPQLFKEGRSIKNGILTQEIGGGLCQISGIIYHLSLLANLEITERFPHSMDIYTNETRFSPLGTDATVVFGYKDLRIRNNQQFPLIFNIIVEENTLKATLFSPKKLQTRDLIFKIEENNNLRISRILDQNQKLISQSIYKTLQNNN